MSVSTACDICGRSPAHDRCNRCASFVCPDHYAVSLGLCTDCAAEVSR